MEMRTLLFLARKDLLNDLRVLLLVLLGVGSGALAIIPLNGLLAGFITSLTASTIDVAAGHLVLSPPEGGLTIRNDQMVVAEVATMPGVEAVSSRLFAQVIASNGDSTEAAAIRGVDPVAETRATRITGYLVAGDFLKPHDQDVIVIGRSLANKLNIGVGQSMALLFTNGSTAHYMVRGIYDTGLVELDNGGYVPLQQLQAILNLPNQASEITVRLKDKEQSEAIAAQLESQWKVETWQERLAATNQGLQRSINIIRRMMVMLSVLATGIATAVLMYTSVQHKIRAIGILKAIGSRNRAILRLYILEGLLLGITGAAVGDILGSTICLYLSAYPIQASIGASQGETHIVSVNASFSWSLLIAPTLSAVIVATLASLYPAWQAARTNIVEAIWHG